MAVKTETQVAISHRNLRLSKPWRLKVYFELR